MAHRFAVGALIVLLAIVGMTIAPARTDGPRIVMSASAADRTPRPEPKKRRIVVLGAHPEDPVFGCGGLVAQLTKTGHEVIIAYVSCYRRDRRVGDESEAEIRHRESVASCKVLGATLHFFDYEHETLTADRATIDTIAAWLREVKPDIVVTHWPVDAQSNHHITSSIVWQSYLRDKKFSLYFFEVLNDRQTIAFKPDLYLDIADVKDSKKDACFCHTSQMPQGFWVDHEDMHKLRGEECGCRYAEAYVLAEHLPGRAQLPVHWEKRLKN